MIPKNKLFYLENDDDFYDDDGYPIGWRKSDSDETTDERCADCGYYFCASDMVFFEVDKIYLCPKCSDKQDGSGGILKLANYLYQRKANVV